MAESKKTKQQPTDCTPSAEKTGLYEQVIKYKVKDASKDQHASSILIRTTAGTLWQNRIETGEWTDMLNAANRTPTWYSDTSVAAHCSDIIGNAVFNIVESRDLEAQISLFARRIIAEAPTPDNAGFEMANMLRWAGVVDVIGEAAVDVEVAEIRKACTKN